MAYRYEMLRRESVLRSLIRDDDNERIFNNYAVGGNLFKNTDIQSDNKVGRLQILHPSGDFAVA